MNLTTLAVSELVKHILCETLIPRVKDEIKKNKENKDKVCHYKTLIAHYRNIVDNKSVQLAIAQKTMNSINNHFRYLRKEDLEDFIGEVINFTIQSKTNDYGKLRKSQYGFWVDTFDLSRDPTTFENTFSYFLYKAVQSETRSLYYRQKHEVNLLYNENDECLKLNELADTKETDVKEASMNEFEMALVNFRQKVLESKILDEIDLSIFNKWWELKNSGSFFQNINMAVDVYRPLLEGLKDQEIKFSESSMHYRWKKIQKVMKSSMKKIE